MAKDNDSSTHETPGSKGMNHNIKALFWPGVMMYKILELLKM